MTTPSIKRFAWAWGPVMMVIGASFVLSSMPIHRDHYWFFENEDKLFHGVEFSIIGGLIFRAFLLSTTWKVISCVTSSVTFGALYGALDEVHQLFTPGREADVLDFLADFTGICLGVALWAVYRAILSRGKHDSTLQTKHT